MLAKRTLWFAFIGLLVLVGILSTFLYRPPLLRSAGFLTPARLFDQLGFAWHHNKAFWYEAQRKELDARREYLASAWYRPAYLPKYTDTPLNLERLTLDDWTKVGNLYSEADLHKIARQALAQAVALGASDAQTFENLAKAEEKAGDATRALELYRSALSLDESRFRSLSGLERLGNMSEKEISRARLEELATKLLQVEQMTADIGSLAIGGGWNLWTNGALHGEVRLLAGRNLMRVFARGLVAAEEWPLMAILVEDRETDRIRVASEQWQAFDFSLDVAETDIYHISIRFMNDYNDKETGEDRNLYIQKVVFERS